MVSVLCCCSLCHCQTHIISSTFSTCSKHLRNVSVTTSHHPNHKPPPRLSISSASTDTSTVFFLLCPNPLLSTQVTDTKTRRGLRKGSTSSSSSSSSSAPPDPLSSMLDGTDPLSLFAAASATETPAMSHSASTGVSSHWRQTDTVPDVFLPLKNIQSQGKHRNLRHYCSYIYQLSVKMFSA